MAVEWITPAGNLGILTERVPIDLVLSASSDQDSITYSVIAGRLPRGLRLENNRIKGSPVEVNTFTESRFVVRVDDGVDIEDRTFKLSIDGSDEPRWLTKEGYLNVGSGNAYFVLDNAFVDFQLDVEDPDLIAGDTLEFFISPMGGELPPGLILTRDGRITGFTDPIFSVEYGSDLSGDFDTTGYDIAPLDRAEAKSNGYDSYLYDLFTFGYTEESKLPRRLSRSYTFVVSVTDGRNEVRRLFRMWVVTEEFLKADNTIVQVDTNLFTSDASSTRAPIWITESDLGRHRANNYLTVFLEVYRAPGLSTSLSYFLLDRNPDGSISEIPPGMTIDQSTGEIAGRVPYQAAVSRTYAFSVQAVDFLLDTAESSYNLRGTWNSSITYTVNDAVTYLGFIYICLQDHRNLIPTEAEDFWLPSISISEKTFSIEIVGEIESAIRWISDENLGSIKPNLPSTISLEASSNFYGNQVFYEFVSGKLPPGLELLSTGDIAGKVKQFADDSGLGLTRFYDDTSGTKTFNTTFDGSNTSFDLVFEFQASARDSVGFAINTKSFYITVDVETGITYANLYVKALQTKSKRLTWFNFITDNNIFRTEDIYRYGDPGFGVQSEIKIILFAGIESTEAVTYVQAMSRNHYNKRFTFGDIKYAKAKDPITQETIYEAVYIDIVDSLEKNGKSISNEIQLRDDINSKVLVSYDAIKIDSDIPLVSDSDHQRVFPNSIKNMRSRIAALGGRNREFLPLWMRSIQDDGIFESGFVNAFTICYAKPGKSQEIISRIKLSGFDFKQLDFEIDRYLIDVLDNNFEDKYLAFPQRGEKLP